MAIKKYLLITTFFLIKISLLNAQKLSNESILPTEVLEEIFKHVKSPKDLKNIRLTSKEFRNLVPIRKIGIDGPRLSDSFLRYLRLYADAKKASEDLQYQKKRVDHLCLWLDEAHIPFTFTNFDSIKKITIIGNISKIYQNNIETSLKKAVKAYVRQNEFEKKERYWLGFRCFLLSDRDFMEIIEEDKRSVDELLSGNSNITIPLQDFSKYFPNLESLIIKENHIIK